MQVTISASQTREQPYSDGRVSLQIPLRIKRSSGSLKVASTTLQQTEPVELTPLQRGLQQALLWQHMLDSGRYRNIRALAKGEGEGMDNSYVSRILKLTLLPTDLVNEVLNQR